MVLIYILLAVIIVSLISLAGVLTLVLKKNITKILSILVSMAAGALLGTAFLDIIPEAIEVGGESALQYVLFGIVVFFVLEKFLYWYHCHEGKCDIHTHGRKPAPFTYLNIVGDGLHNFIDGMILTASFLTDVSLGIITTIAVIFHEIPQEIGDFGVLVYGGLKPGTALLYNFLSACTAVVGALVAYYFSTTVEGFSAFLLPAAAGGFIYIASVDLLPELHKELTFEKSAQQLAFFLFGIFIIYILSQLFAH